MIKIYKAKVEHNKNTKEYYFIGSDQLIQFLKGTRVRIDSVTLDSIVRLTRISNESYTFTSKGGVKIEVSRIQIFETEDASREIGQMYNGEY